MKTYTLGRQYQTKNLKSSTLVTNSDRYSERSLRRQALAKAQQGKYTEALAIFSHLISLNPHHASDYNNRGLIYFQSGQMEKAIADYQTAIQLNPHLASVHNNLANYYAAIGQLSDAIAAYDTAIDLNPSYIRAWINQGITFRQLELYNWALENFDFALLLGQFESCIYAQRGRTYHLRGDWNCAIADYLNAFKHLPKALSPNDPALKLRSQVKTWYNELLNFIPSSEIDD